MEEMELIEAYVEGKLAGESLISFEAQLQSDAVLRNEVAQFRVLISGINLAGERKFSQKVREWEKAATLLDQATQQSQASPLPQSAETTTSAAAKSDQTPEPGRTASLTWLYAAVPTAVMVILLAIWVYPHLFPPSMEELYTQNFVPYPDLYTSMGDGPDARQAAIAFYNEQNYEQAAESFTHILQTQSKDYQLYMYVGISYLESGLKAEALQTFDHIIANAPNNYREPAQWYKALTYLKYKQLGESRDMLQIILAQESHAYQARAQRLLKKLRKL